MREMGICAGLATAADVVAGYIHGVTDSDGPGGPWRSSSARH